MSIKDFIKKRWQVCQCGHYQWQHDNSSIINKKIYNENIKKIKQAVLEYVKTEFKDLKEGFIEEYTTNNIIPLIKNE